MDGERLRLEDEEMQGHGMPGIPFRIRSRPDARSRPSGSESSPPMPTISADSESTSVTTRMREKPSARSAAISPRRWFTETVSSTVISSTANDTVTVVSTVEIWRKYVKPVCWSRPTTSCWSRL